MIKATEYLEQYEYALYAGNLLAIIDEDPKPGDINEDGKEIEQDGDVTWE